MEVVNCRYARFAGSKFKARRALGPRTIVGPRQPVAVAAIEQGRFAIGGARRLPMEIQRKLRSRFDESEFPRQNREWTRAGKHSRHNCMYAGKEPGQTRNGAETEKSVYSPRVCTDTIRYLCERMSKIPLAEKLRNADDDDRCAMTECSSVTKR